MSGIYCHEIHFHVALPPTSVYGKLMDPANGAQRGNPVLPCWLSFAVYIRCSHLAITMNRLKLDSCLWLERFLVGCEKVFNLKATIRK